MGVEVLTFARGLKLTGLCDLPHRAGMWRHINPEVWLMTRACLQTCYRPQAIAANKMGTLASNQVDARKNGIIAISAYHRASELESGNKRRDGRNPNTE